MRRKVADRNSGIWEMPVKKPVGSRKRAFFQRAGAAPMSEGPDLLAVVRAAVHERSVAKRELRERIHRQRQRFASTLRDSRKELGQRLLAAAGIGQADLDSLSKREEETIRTFLAEEQRAIASRPH